VLQKKLIKEYACNLIVRDLRTVNNTLWLHTDRACAR